MPRVSGTSDVINDLMHVTSVNSLHHSEHLSACDVIADTKPDESRDPRRCLEEMHLVAAQRPRRKMVPMQSHRVPLLSKVARCALRNVVRRREQRHQIDEPAWIKARLNGSWYAVDRTPASAHDQWTSWLDVKAFCISI